MSEKTKKIKNNVVSKIVNQVVLIAISLLLPKLYLENFGSEVNGILSTIKQIFVYLFLLEAGVGGAATQSLYGPIRKKAYGNVNSIISAMHNYYCKIGFIYSAIVFIIGIVYAFVIPTPVSSGTVFGIIILTGLPAIFSFFVQSKYRILLVVNDEESVITNSETILQILANLGKILVLFLTNNLVLIQLVYCILYIMQLWYIVIVAKRKYKWLDFKVKPDKDSIKNSDSVLVHQLSSMVFNNTDVLLLSLLCDLKVVSVYAIYNIFFSQVQTFIGGIVSSFHPAFGKMYDDKENRSIFIKTYNIYETFHIMATFIIYTLMAVFLLPLIQIYTQGVNDANYSNVLLVFLFVIMNLLANGKLPSNHVLEWSGKFKETRSHAIIEMIINLTVSVVAILKWGICGAIVGTIIALLYRGSMMIYYSNKIVLERSVFNTYKLWIVNGAVFAFIMFVFFVDSFSGLSFVNLLIKGIIHSLWMVPLYLIVNFIFFKTAFKDGFELWRNKK